MIGIVLIVVAFGITGMMLWAIYHKDETPGYLAYKAHVGDRNDP